MPKFLAVCGAPGVGKTVTALKLAQEINESTAKRTLFFSPDLTVPLLGFLFPHCKADDLYSVGETFDRTEIVCEDVLRQIVTVKAMRDFGYLGFKAGETRYSYPAPTEDKIRQFFACLRQLADYVVVDCVSDADYLISSMARSEADTVLYIVHPDLKSIAYDLSHEEMFAGCADRLIHVMNCGEKDMYLPMDDVKKHFKTVEHTLPYSFALHKQSYTGTLAEHLTDPKYRAAMQRLAKVVTV